VIHIGSSSRSEAKKTADSKRKNFRG
jgi:hypothetical protein